MQNPCYLLTIHAIINKYARYALHRKREKENFVSNKIYETNELEEPKAVWFQADDKEDVNQIFIITSTPKSQRMDGSPNSSFIESNLLFTIKTGGKI